MSPIDRSRPLIFAFFFSSGFAALLYQIVWLKYLNLNLLFGSTTYATAAVLSAFMFGLSLGSRVAPRVRVLFRNSLRAYGLVEMGVGLFACAFPWLYQKSSILFGVLFNLVGPQSSLYTALVFAVAFLVLLIPTSLMGATLPVLAHSVIRGDSGIAQKTGFLYAVNTLGAVAGILCSAFLLIPTLGLHATVYLGVLINLGVGLICFLAGKAEDPAAEPPRMNTSGPRLLKLYLVSGLLAIGYEVFWTRILVLHLGSSVYAYAIMLAVFLIGISCGSAAGGGWLEKAETDPERFFGRLQLAWAFSILLQLLLFAHLSDLLYFLATMFQQITTTTHFLVLFLASLCVLLLPTFLSGALFPTVVRALWLDGRRIEEAASLAYSYNTIGGIFGSIVACFLLIPTVGTQLALVIFGATNMLLGLLAARKKEPLIVRTTSVLLFAATAFILQTRVSILRDAGIFRAEDGDRLVRLEEDSTSTISVEQRTYMKRPYLSLSVNGVNVAGSSPQLVTIQKMQGNIPMMLYGPDKPARVLHIGFGSGGTAYAVSLFPKTDITVVELSRGIVRNADASFRSENHGIVDSGRLRFIYFDGRSFLQNTRDSFDVILSDSIHPRYSGNGSLYTKDYYELVYRRLNNGGVHSQWIPTYSLSEKNLREILRAFWEVFPETYVWYVNSSINPYVVVTGKKGNSRISFREFAEGARIPAVQQDLRSVNVPDAYHLLDYFLFGPKGTAEYVKDADPHMDDRMTVEYESSLVLNKALSWWSNYRDLLSCREPVLQYLSDAEAFDSDIYHRFYEASTHNLQGQLLFIAGNRDDARKRFSAAVAMNPADTDPIEYSWIGF